jgi:hypothetical protein
MEEEYEEKFIDDSLFVETMMCKMFDTNPNVIIPLLLFTAGRISGLAGVPEEDEEQMVDIYFEGLELGREIDKECQDVVEDEIDEEKPN